MTRICALIIFALVLAFAPAAFAQEAKELSAKQRAVAPIAAFTAKGDQAKLRTAMERGLGAGLSVNEIKEILIQMYAYCGFPRSGHENRVKLTGSTALGSYAKVVPTIDIFLKEHLFADIFERGVLTWQEREIATVAALVSLDGTEAQRRSHTRCCMNTGVTAAQMEDLARTLRAEVGEYEGAAAEQALKEALAARK